MGAKSERARVCPAGNKCNEWPDGLRDPFTAAESISLLGFCVPPLKDPHLLDCDFLDEDSLQSNSYSLQSSSEGQTLTLDGGLGEKCSKSPMYGWCSHYNACLFRVRIQAFCTGIPFVYLSVIPLRHSLGQMETPLRKSG